jgi:hypothetical protein
MLVLLNTDSVQSDPDFYIQEFKIEPYNEMESFTSKFDLTFYFMQRGNSLVLTLAYNSSLFSATFVNEIAEGYCRICEQLERNEELTVEEMKNGLLSTSEKAEHDNFLNKMMSPINEEF